MGNHPNALARLCRTVIAVKGARVNVGVKIFICIVIYVV